LFLIFLLNSSSIKKRLYPGSIAINGGSSSSSKKVKSSPMGKGFGNEEMPSLASIASGKKLATYKVDLKNCVDRGPVCTLHISLNINASTNMEKRKRIAARVRKMKTERAATEMHEDYKVFINKLSELPGPPVTLVNEVDDEPSPPVDFEFITSLRLGKNVPEYDDGFTFGCECPVSGCVDPTECTDLIELQDGHRQFAYNKHGRNITDNQLAIFECNHMCSCGPSCSNRVVQRGRKIPLEIFKTKDKGWGELTVIRPLTTINTDSNYRPSLSKKASARNFC
jgi:hypothetical protein